MNYEYFAAVVAGISTLAGILTSNSLTLYRIKQLEHKIEKYNNLNERTAINEQEIKAAFSWIDKFKEVLK